VTRRARLTSPAAGDPFARVAGMTVLLRQLLSLQDAGIDEVDVEGIPADRLPTDLRLRLAVRPVDTASPAPRSTGETVLRARLGLVWHRLLAKRLVRIGYVGDLEAAPLEPDEFVVAVTDAASAQCAEESLFQSLLKATDGLISRAINRRISLPITRALIDTSITPNQMTAFAAAVGFAAIAIVLWGGVPWLVGGALLLQTQSILDGCDGEISRLKYIRSRLGEWLDQVLDDLVNLGFFWATGWALYRDGSSTALPITVAGTTSHIVYQICLYAALLTRGGGSGSVASIRWWGQIDESRRRPLDQPRGVLRTVKETLELAGRRDFFTFFYLPAALIGLPQIALWLCAVIYFLSALSTTLEWLLKGGPQPAARAS